MSYILMCKAATRRLRMVCGKCKDCKFWEVSFHNVCDLATFNDYDDVSDSSFMVDFGADDDQGSWGRLKTGPNFGCIQFKSKGK